VANCTHETSGKKSLRGKKGKKGNTLKKSTALREGVGTVRVKGGNCRYVVKRGCDSMPRPERKAGYLGGKKNRIQWQKRGRGGREKSRVLKNFIYECHKQENRSRGG